MVGQVSINADIEQVNVLHEYHFNWTVIANIMDIHGSTFQEKFKKCCCNFEEKYSIMS